MSSEDSIDEKTPLPAPFQSLESVTVDELKKAICAVQAFIPQRESLEYVALYQIFGRIERQVDDLMRGPIRDPMNVSNNLFYLRLVKHPLKLLKNREILQRMLEVIRDEIFLLVDDHRVFQVARHFLLGASQSLLAFLQERELHTEILSQRSSLYWIRTMREETFEFEILPSFSDEESAQHLSALTRAKKSGSLPQYLEYIEAVPTNTLDDADFKDAYLALFPHDPENFVDPRSCLHALLYEKDQRLSFLQSFLQGLRPLKMLADLRNPSLGDMERVFRSSHVYTFTPVQRATGTHQTTDVLLNNIVFFKPIPSSPHGEKEESSPYLEGEDIDFFSQTVLNAMRKAETHEDFMRIAFPSWDPEAQLSPELSDRLAVFSDHLHEHLSDGHRDQAAHFISTLLAALINNPAEAWTQEINGKPSLFETFQYVASTFNDIKVLSEKAYEKYFHRHVTLFEKSVGKVYLNKPQQLQLLKVFGGFLRNQHILRSRLFAYLLERDPRISPMSGQVVFNVKGRLPSLRKSHEGLRLLVPSHGEVNLVHWPMDAEP